MAFGRSAHQNQFALLGRDHQISSGEKQLTVAVTAALPLHVASFWVETFQNRLVEAVNVALIEHR